MLHDLMEVYNSLIEKDHEIMKIANVLGYNENQSFLDKVSVKVEHLIVQSVGGNEEHLEALEEINLFYRYRNNKITKEAFIKELKKAVKNQ